MWGFSNNQNGFLQGCNCNGQGHQFPAQPCSPPFPGCCPPQNGCPILLDTACVIYHKNMNSISGLVNLNLPNGSTAELIFNTIDVWIGYLNAAVWAVPNLRLLGFTINTLPQFAAAVDTEIGLFTSQIAALTAAANTPITPVNTASIDILASGTLNHTIQANVNISGATGNTLIENPDGLYVVPQTLSIDYTAKTLSITEGNTVDFSSLLCQTGWLGNVTADPVGAIDGDYWFRTDLSAANGLRIHVNGTVRTIPTV